MDDRRIFERIKVKFPARFLDSTSGREGSADTVDVSANGLGLIIYEDLPDKTPLEMWLDIPDQRQPLYTRGEVVWTKDLAEGQGKHIGVRLEKAELMGLARVLWLKDRA